MDFIQSFIENFRLDLFLISLGLSILTISLFIFVYSKVKSSNERNRVSENLRKVLEDVNYYSSENKDEDNDTRKITLVSRWNEYWLKTLSGAGLVRFSKTPGEAGNSIALLFVIVSAIVFVLSKSIIIALVAGGASLFLVSWYGRRVFYKKEAKLNEQLPGFLFSLKSSLQSGASNESALIKVTEAMPSPLYENLNVARKELLASRSFKHSLESMRDKANSRELKFLCSCMIQASASGGSISSQIDSIKNVLDERRRVANEIKKSEKETSVAIYLSSVVIPAMFLGMYSLDPSVREFWFVHPFSWLALLAVGFFYGIGIFLTRKMVNGVKNL